MKGERPSNDWLTETRLIIKHMKYPDTPANCPDCGHFFSTIIRPKTKFTKKGITLLLAGTIVSILWMAFIATVIVVTGVAVVFANPAAWFLGLVILLGPGLTIGAFAFNQRCITLKCIECGWRKTYAMETHNVQQTEDATPPEDHHVEDANL